MRLRNAALIFIVVDDRVVLLRQEVLRSADPAGARGLDGRAAVSEPVFVFTSPTEPFWVYTKLAMYGALLVASPVHHLGALEVRGARVSTARRSGWRWW